MNHIGMYAYREASYGDGETIIHRCPHCNMWHPTVMTVKVKDFPLEIQEKIAERALAAFERASEKV